MIRAKAPETVAAAQKVISGGAKKTKRGPEDYETFQISRNTFIAFIHTGAIVSGRCEPAGVGPAPEGLVHRGTPGKLNPARSQGQDDLAQNPAEAVLGLHESIRLGTLGDPNCNVGRNHSVGCRRCAGRPVVRDSAPEHGGQAQGMEHGTGCAEPTHLCLSDHAGTRRVNRRRALDFGTQRDVWAFHGTPFKETSDERLAQVRFDC